MLRVLLVDDEPGIRVVLRTALRLRRDIQVVGEATTTFSAAQLAVEHEPDLVVLDLGLPDSHGSHSYLKVHAATPDSRFVIYTGSDAERSWFRDRGVSFVGKNGDLTELLETVERTVAS